MAKPRAILKRKKSVQGIAKITKTMQMIAQAKFKKTFDRAVAARPYTDRLFDVVATLSAAATEFTHPLLSVPPAPAAGGPRRVVIVAIASNRGLCGGYNSNITRATLRACTEAESRGMEVHLVVAGRKLGSALKFQGRPPVTVHTTFDDKPRLAQVVDMGREFVEAYARGEVAEVQIVYTKFESSSKQTAVVERALPFPLPQQGAAKTKAHDWIFDPDAKTILSDLIPRAVRLKFFQAFLDAAVSEQVARMTAMKAATDNAKDVITALGRQFNRSRQSLITTELTEIMGGAAALE